MKISKELQKIFQQLIPIYEDAIKNLPVTNWQMFLNNNFLQFGICYKAENCLYKDLDDNKEMKKITKFFFKTNTILNYWYKIPYHCEERDEVIECLQFRVDKMKELINNKN